MSSHVTTSGQRYAKMDSMSGGGYGMTEGSPWEHAYAHVDNMRIHYVTAGEGPLMIMLHGFPEFWYSWRHQIPAMAEYFRVVAPDMRGYNQTEKPVGIRNYRMRALLGDLRGLIASLGESSAILVAHDWGGSVAWTFSAHFADMVDRLVVLNCPPTAVLVRHLAKNRAQLKRSYYMFLFQLPFLPEAALRYRDYRRIERIFRGLAADKSAFSEHDIVMLKEAAAKPGALTASINYYRAGLRRMLIPSGVGKGNRPKVSCPTLVIWGEKDRALGKELTYDFQEEVEGPLQIVYIPDCGHWVQQEKPEQVNSHILEFLLNDGM